MTTPPPPEDGPSPVWEPPQAAPPAAPGPPAPPAAPGPPAPGIPAPGGHAWGTPYPPGTGTPYPPGTGTPYPPGTGTPGANGFPAPGWGSPPVPRPRSRPSGATIGRVGTGLAGGAALAGKAGLITKLLVMIKGIAVLGKVKVFASMLLSVGAYAVFWGWKFAVGFVILLAIHEFGHVVALRLQGIPASAPMFIPFVGAYVAMREMPRTAADEAWIAMAGPAAGLIGSAACLQLGLLGHSPLLQALAYTGFLLNLFNLLPILPLDGGRVAGALHPAIWLGGIGLAVVVLVWRPSPILGFILVIGGFEAWRRWRAHRDGRDNGYAAVPAATRGWIAAGYVALAALCLYGMSASYLPSPL